MDFDSCDYLIYLQRGNHSHWNTDLSAKNASFIQNYSKIPGTKSLKGYNTLISFGFEVVSVELQ